MRLPRWLRRHADPTPNPLADRLSVVMSGDAKGAVAAFEQMGEAATRASANANPVATHSHIVVNTGASPNAVIARMAINRLESAGQKVREAQADYRDAQRRAQEAAENLRDATDALAALQPPPPKKAAPAKKAAAKKPAPKKKAR